MQDLAALRDTTGSGIALLDVRTPEEYGEQRRRVWTATEH